MPQIIQSGSVNPTVPDAYINIIQPTNGLVAGVPTNILGIVGTASWGPVNSPQSIGGNDEQVNTFGPVIARAHDLSTAVAIAVLQGNNNMRCVRVTDGTDVAASGLLDASGTTETATIAGTATLNDVVTLTFTPTPGVAVNVPYTVQGTDTPTTIATALLALLQANAALTAAGFSFTRLGAVITYNYPTSGSPTWAFTSNVSGGATETVTLASHASQTPTQLSVASLYTGSYGNNCTVTLANGSKSGTFKATVTMPNFRPEVFDNIAGVGNLLWQNMASAINNGQSGVRGPSQLIVATAGVSAIAPSVGAITLAGGTDGASGVTSATLVGSDTAPRTGMYALRAQGCAVGTLADLADSTKWSVMDAFGVSEGVFMGDASPAGDTIATFVSTLAGTGVDDPWFKALLGDWIFWFDQVNGVQRLISPATFWAAKRAATTPQNSTLNKPISGIVGTQKSATGQAYTQADLTTLFAGRGDVIANPAPGGAYFAARSGRNCSSNAAIRGENYTMMTDFLAGSLATFVGQVVGQLQTQSQRQQAKATLDNFFQSLANANPPLIGNADGTQPWQVVLNASNNPANLVALGYERIDISVQYLAVIEELIVNLEGGQTVSITRNTLVQG